MKKTIIEKIEDKKRITTAELSDNLNIPYNTIQRRLRKMRHAGVVDCKKGVWFKV